MCYVGSGSSAAIDLTMRSDPGSPPARPPTRHRRRWPALASTGVLCGRVGAFPLRGLTITGGNEMIYPYSDASTQRFVSLHNVAENLRQAIIFAALLLSEHEAPSGIDLYC